MRHLPPPHGSGGQVDISTLLSGGGTLPKARPPRRPIAVPHGYIEWQYLRHPSDASGFHSEASSRTTRFLPGFYRRPQTVIQTQYERPAVTDARERRRELNTSYRRAYYEAHDKVNPVTGEPVRDRLATFPTNAVPLSQPPPASVAPLRACGESRRRLPGEPSAEYRREGDIRLKNSALRYFGSDPKPVATTSDGRPVEGLTHTARTSSVIGYGRAELPTRGAVDALALAAYADSPAARAEPRQPPSTDLLRRAKEAARPPWVA